MARFRVRLLSEAVVETIDGEVREIPRGKPFAALAFLALHRGPVTRAELSRVLWPSLPPDQARGALRTVFWILRNRLSRDLIAGKDPIRLTEGVLTTDVQELEGALERGDLAVADELFVTPPMDGLVIANGHVWDRWLEEYRTSWGSRTGSLLSFHAGRLVEGGDVEAAESAARMAVRADPHRLTLRIGLIELLIVTGRIGPAEQALAEARSCGGGKEENAQLDELESRINAHRRINTGGKEAPLHTDLVGRSQPLALLLKAWGDAASGLGTVRIVEGEPGCGKSRVVEAVAASIEGTGGQVVRARGTLVEKSLDFATVAAVVRRLDRRPGAAGISRASRSVLRSIVPGVSTGPEETGSTPGVISVAEALVDLVHAVGEEGPLLIVVDDLQWADQLSRQAFSHLAHSLHHHPVLLLVALSSDSRNAALCDVVDSLGRVSTLSRIRLERLSRDDLTVWLGQLIDWPDPARAFEVATSLHRASRGIPALVSEALEELVGNGALRTDGSGWTFDESRLADPIPLPPTRREELRQARVHRRRTAYRVAAAIAVVLIASVARAFGAPNPELDRLPYGEGSLFVLSTDSVREYRAPEMPDAPWAIVGTRPAPEAPGPIWGPFRTTRGFPLWATNVERRGSGEEPPWVGVMDSVGSVREVWRSSGDDGFLDVSPDGRLALVVTERRAGPSFAQDVVVVDIDTGKRVRQLYEAEDKVAAGAWSPDGARVALVTTARVDTLVVLSPTGAVVSRIADPEIPTLGALDWCSDSETLVGWGEVRGMGRLVRIEAGHDRFESFENVYAAARGIECVGHASAAAFVGVKALNPELFLHDFERGTVISVSAPVDQLASRILWVPDSLPPVFRTVEVESDVGRLLWGERVALQALGERTDGSLEAADVRWHSTDPSVLWVGADGVVTGFGAGVAQVIGDFRGWLADTVSIEVVGDAPAGALWFEGFANGLAAWHRYGDRGAEIHREGELHWLAFVGDGRYSDGVRSKAAVEMAGGLTVEVDFRFELKNDHGQYLNLCLEDSEFRESGSPTINEDWVVGEKACLRYPGRELQKLDPRRALLEFRGNGVQQQIPVPRGLDRGDWHTLSLETSPDGHVEVFVNRESMGRSEFPLRVRANGQWRVNMNGAGVGGAPAVRNVRVWAGLRSRDEGE